MSSKNYRPTSTYLSQDPELRQKQLGNLMQGRLRRGMEASVEAPRFKDPAYQTDIIKFAEEQFFIPEGKKPIELQAWQKEEILQPLFYGPRPYTMALLGLPKKSGKSTLAAMIAAWYLFQGEDNGEIYLAARDKDQASWIVFDKLVKAIEMNRQMFVRCQITKDTIKLPHKGTILRCLSTDVSCAGLNPSLVIFDELWSYEYEGMRAFFEEMTTVPTRQHPLVLIVTYAGYDEDSLLYELYQKGLKGGDPSFFFSWSHENRMPWQTEAYLKQQQGRLRGNTYLRLHENHWTSGSESFIDMELWQGCIDRNYTPLLPNKEIDVVVGVDIGIAHDTSAVVAVTRDENKIKLVCHRKWQPTKKNPIDLEETVEAYIKELEKGYTVREVRYDPYQFHRSAMTLAKEGINMVEFPQTSDRLIDMSQNLYDLIKGGNLVLYNDKEMKQHAQKATAKEMPRGWRIVKKKASHKIDLIIALAMAALGATKIEDTGDLFFSIDIFEGEKEKAKEETEEERRKRIYEDESCWEGIGGSDFY